MNSGEGDEADGGERFLFDQEARHDMFWRFVREKNWEGVESFFEKRVSRTVVAMPYSTVLTHHECDVMCNIILLTILMSCDHVICCYYLYC